MSHDPGSGSGNRWEPPATQPLSASDPVPDPGGEDGRDPDPAGAPDPDVAPAAPSRPRRARGLLAGVAAAFLVGGGAAGYAVGHVATSDAVPAGQQQDQRPDPGPGADGQYPNGQDFGGQHFGGHAPDDLDPDDRLPGGDQEGTGRADGGQRT